MAVVYLFEQEVRRVYKLPDPELLKLRVRRPGGRWRFITVSKKHYAQHKSLERRRTGS